MKQVAAIGPVRLSLEDGPRLGRKYNAVASGKLRLGGSRFLGGLRHVLFVVDAAPKDPGDQTAAVWNTGNPGNRSDTVGAGGCGPRYELARKFGSHIRIDVARGHEDRHSYSIFSSAWSRPSRRSER